MTDLTSAIFDICNAPVKQSILPVREHPFDRDADTLCVECGQPETDSWHVDETDEDRYQRAVDDPDRWHTQQKEEW